MYNRSTQRYNVMYHYINKIFDSTVYFAEGVLSTVNNYIITQEVGRMDGRSLYNINHPESPRQSGILHGQAPPA